MTRGGDEDIDGEWGGGVAKILDTPKGSTENIVAL